MAKSKKAGGAAEKSYGFPKDLGACLKMLAALHRKSEKLLAQLQPVAAEESALREHLLQTFKKTELNGARGSGANISVVQSVVPTIGDHDVFMAFASKKANWDLLNRAVSTQAWRERLDAGKSVPGVVPYDRVSLRVTWS